MRPSRPQGYPFAQSGYDIVVEACRVVIWPPLLQDPRAVPRAASYVNNRLRTLKRDATYQIYRRLRPLRLEAQAHTDSPGTL